MQSNNPANDASSSSHACNLFSGGIPVDDGNRDEQAATGQAGAAQQPRLHAGNRSGTPLLSDDKRPDDHDRARELDALNDQLCSLHANVPPDLKQALHFFGDVKASEQAIKTLLRDDPHNAALRKLADGLRAILPHLHVLLCGDDGPNPSLDLHTIHILCMGLSTCVAPAMGAMFDKKRLQQLKPHLQAITKVLMECACKAGFLQSATASIGTVLDILNWASRALKADCIDVSPSIRKVFDEALDVFEEALAGKTGPCGLTPHQIGKCAVQISAIFKFSLIRLDNSEQSLAGCHRLTAAASDCVPRRSRPVWEQEKSMPWSARMYPI